jgi:AcrR family transcriptional regulator
MSKAESSQPLKKSVGRPKSLASRNAILGAARDLLDEVGPHKLTIDGVAKRAGVGKPTIYRTWANAQELAMAALVERVEVGAAADTSLKVHTIEDLVESIIVRLNTKRGRQVALMLASGEPDGELFKAFANRVILQGRQEGLNLLQHMQARGEIRADVDLSMSLDMIFGALMLRLLLRHEGLDPTLARGSLAIIMDGVKV